MLIKKKFNFYFTCTFAHVNLQPIGRDAVASSGYPASVAVPATSGTFVGVMFIKYTFIKCPQERLEIKQRVWTKSVIMWVGQTQKHLQNKEKNNLYSNFDVFYVL